MYHFSWVVWSPDHLIVVQLSHAWLNSFPHSGTWIKEWPHEFPVVHPGLSWQGNQRDASYTCFPCRKVVSRYNGLWLDLTGVCWNSWHRAWYRSVCFDGCQLASMRSSHSLDQTTRRCSSLSQLGDKYSGKDEAQWGPIVSCDEPESWSSSKGTQLRGIGLSRRKVVVIQEIEPKVCFLILQSLYTYMGTAFKAPLEPCIVHQTLVQLS